MGEVYINPSPPAVSQCWEVARKAGRVVNQGGVEITCFTLAGFYQVPIRMGGCW